MLRFISITLLLISFTSQSQTWQDIILNHNDTIGLYNALIKGGVPKNEFAGIIKSKLFKLSHPNYYQPFQSGSFKTADTNATCTNPGFEDSTFTGWSGKSGHTPAYGGCCATNGFITNRHTIMYGSGVDLYAPVIPVVNPNGGTYSVRLGNDDINGEKEQLLQTFTVTPDKKSFTYSYAVVLEDPAGHDVTVEPFFETAMFDASGDTIPCSYYRVSGEFNATGLDSFFMGTPPWTYFAGIYKNWTDVTIDLSAYLGQQVTIKFTVADCDYGGHFGYVYLDTRCENSDLIPPYFCPGDTEITFTAPAGYNNYLWLRNSSDTLGTTQNVNITNPVLYDLYEVYLTPFKSGGQDTCAFKLSYKLDRNPHPVLPDYILKQNVITANSDLLNDKMETDRFMYTDKFAIKIYNRWGKLVFESDDYKKEWDCSDSNPGTYFFHAFFTNTCYPDKEPVISKGYVEVLK